MKKLLFTPSDFLGFSSFVFQFELLKAPQFYAIKYSDQMLLWSYF